MESWDRLFSESSSKLIGKICDGKKGIYKKLKTSQGNVYLNYYKILLKPGEIIYVVYSSKQFFIFINP